MTVPKQKGDDHDELRRKMEFQNYAQFGHSYTAGPNQKWTAEDPEVQDSTPSDESRPD